MKAKHILLAFIGFSCLALGSCSLDEINPSGGPTVEEYWSTPDGYNKLINGCYWTLGRSFYGGEDYTLYWAEVGTDIWQAPRQLGWMKEAFFYSGLNSGTNTLAESWRAAYEAINLCNAAITGARNAGFSTEKEMNEKVAEAHFVRAYYNLFIVEQWGGIYLPQERLTAPKFDIPRSSVKDFYTLILSDLDFAMKNLPQQQSERGRATRSGAYHVYAKACLQRASYDDVTEVEKQDLLQRAKTASEYLINHQSEFGVSLYEQVEDVFKPENNKNNKEALWVVTHSSIGSLNQNSKYWNRTYKQFGLIDNNMCGVELKIDSLPKFERRIMPSKYLLNLYGKKDSRYEAFFRERYYAVGDYTWTDGDVSRFGKDASFAGRKQIRKGELAMWFTRQSVSDAKARNCAVVDINMIYEANGKVNTTYGVNYFPCLKKLEAPGMYTGELKKSYTYADNIVYRLADTYLLAAEANFRLGEKGQAAIWLNEIRNRACVNHDHSMDVNADDVTWDLILDERARELAGEHTRWMDLKRAGMLQERITKYNPEITEFDPNKHYLRPVPDNCELNFITNPDDFKY